MVGLIMFHVQVLAKLACGLNKPNRQTILPMDSVAELFNTLPISKMYVIFVILFVAKIIK